MTPTLESLIADLTPAEVRQAAFALSEAEAQALLYDWRLWARPEQVAPEGEWRVWVVKSGRGWGKTRTSAEAIREVVNRDPQSRIAIIGPTAADCRDVMVEGESGLMNVFPPHERPAYFPSRRRVEFHNGAIATLYSAEEPERLRGPQHSFAAADELAVYPKVEELWQNLKLGLRLGPDPRIIVTTTPKPSRFLRALLADPGTIVTSGSTFANRANLPASVLADFTRIYGGTRIGRQELEGELLEEAEGALWSRAQIDSLRVRPDEFWGGRLSGDKTGMQMGSGPKHPELVRIVVAIDPSVTATETSDECGIVACGLGADGHGYVLQDLSGRFPPDQWAHRAVSCFDALEADRVIAETNNGGDLVMMVLRTCRQNLPFEKVTASRGKVARAEPVAALTEQGRVHFVGGFPQLEDELCTFVPGGLTKSPNRADAMVWGLSYLMLQPKRVGRVLSL